MHGSLAFGQIWQTFKCFYYYYIKLRGYHVIIEDKVLHLSQAMSPVILKKNKVEKKKGRCRSVSYLDTKHEARGGIVVLNALAKSVKGMEACNMEASCGREKKKERFICISASYSSFNVLTASFFASDSLTRREVGIF
jgi:hypothetical protein